MDELLIDLDGLVTCTVSGGSYVADVDTSLSGGTDADNVDLDIITPSSSWRGEASHSINDSRLSFAFVALRLRRSEFAQRAEQQLPIVCCTNLRRFYDVCVTDEWVTIIKTTKMNKPMPPFCGII